MVFIDTGGWIAVAVVSDAFHEAALSYYFDLISNSVRLFTSNYVLDETITRIRYDFGHLQALRFCELYEQAENKRLVTTLWVDPLVASITLLGREANPHGRDARATWHGHLAHAVLVVKARCMRHAIKT